jgi:hypothetical protein
MILFIILPGMATGAAWLGAGLLAVGWRLARKAVAPGVWRVFQISTIANAVVWGIGCLALIAEPNNLRVPAVVFGLSVASLVAGSKWLKP